MTNGVFPTELLTEVEYVLDVELNVTDVMTLDNLRSILTSGNFSMALSNTVNVTQINITTGQWSVLIESKKDNGLVLTVTCTLCI